MNVLGIDVGGSGIKGAPVDVETGSLAGERLRIATPHPATPAAVAETIADIVRHFEWRGPAGCGFPGVVRRGVVLTAANVSSSWIGVDANVLLEEETGCPFELSNDADAAGVAEMRFGAGRDRSGVVLVLTLGTGIGTSVFLDGSLVPNVELGRLEIRGRVAEQWASDRVRVERGLGWKKWSKRVDAYVTLLCDYFWPELIIIGGGASKKFEKFARYLDTRRCEVVPARLRNQAGIIGAALGVKTPPG